MTVDYNQVSYVIASSYREDIVACLSKGPSTPKGIADQTDSDIAHVSRALGELKEEGVVELLVDEDKRKGRIHGLTEAGKEVAKEIKDSEGRLG